MKFSKIALTLLFSGFVAFTFAQDLPKASPRATVSQTVGLTNISLDYSRPSVKGRTIFGDLLPYDEVWRLGANKATILTTDQPLKFGDQLLRAGSYAVFATPMKDKWEVAFNSNTEQWGTGDYDKSLNVVTLLVETTEAANTESLSITIEDLTMNSASLVIKWENVMVSLPFKVSTNEVAMKNIDAAIAKGEDLDQVYYNASRYFMDIKEYKKSMEYINLSIENKKTFRNLFQQAKLIAEDGDKKKAIAVAEEAHKLALKAEEEGWASYISGAIEKWQK